MRPFPRAGLLRWYRKHKRDLPWRRSPDPYRVWISEIMLQQTQVKNVLPYYARFLKRFPDIASLADAEEEAVLEVWSGLGYYSRARNLWRSARIVAGKRGGRFPDTSAGLLALPGIGPYTAGAILSIAFNRPAPILDGNVRRVLSRYFAQARDRDLWRRAQAEVEAAHAQGFRPADFNQALMELGTMVCLPRAPACGACPARGGCRAKVRGLQARFPAKPKAAATVRRHQVVALLSAKRGRGGSVLYLIQRRPAGRRWFKRLWELPTLESDRPAKPGEIPLADCARALSRQLRLPVRIDRRLGAFAHCVTRHRLSVCVLAGRIASAPRARKDRRWLRKDDLGSVASSSLLRKALALLA